VGFSGFLHEHISEDESRPGHCRGTGLFSKTNG
jgi:hypothetical protein